MRRPVIFIVILVVIEVVADLGARSWAESEITSRAKAELPSSVHVDSHIHAFPFLIPLFTGGRVSEVDGHFENVDAGTLVLSSLNVELHDVRVDRDKLLHERKVRLVSIRDGTVSADITADALTAVLHVPIAITTNQIKVTVGGVAVTANVRVQSNAIDFGVPGVPRVPIPKTRLLPCATDITTLAGRVRVSCTIHNVPAGLVGAANASLSTQ